MDLIWYLADLVTEVRVEGEERSTVLFELFLLQACDAAEAYEKALRIGGSKSKPYLREDGRTLEFVFRGFNDLVAVDEGFVDGARILQRSQVGMSDEDIRAVVTPREYLRAIQAEGRADEKETIH